MGRREYPQRVVCGEPGCGESVTYRHETRRDHDASVRDQQRRPAWKCERHREPPAYLRPGNESTSVVLTAVRVPDRSLRGGFLKGLFWQHEGRSHASTGHYSGPGFIADADEFPEGTRLIVTTQILPPEAAQPPAEEAEPC